MSGKDKDGRAHDMTFENNKFWNVPALRDFLRRRGLSVVGNKTMLVARCFAAWEMKITESEKS